MEDGASPPPTETHVKGYHGEGWCEGTLWGISNSDIDHVTRMKIPQCITEVCPPFSLFVLQLIFKGHPGDSSDCRLSR
jgi:hypothetical protein